MLYTELYRTLWRRKALVAAGTLICVALTVFFTSRQQKQYTATATVRVEPTAVSNANDSYEASQRLARTYAQIYSQGAVVLLMSRYMPGQPPPALKELAAKQLKDLDLLEVSGVSSEPRRAVTIANAGARALEDFSPRERLAPISAATLPDGPSSPNVKLDLLLALVAGFVVSAGAALLLDALLQPIPDADELERTLDVPVLASIPRLDLAAAPDLTAGAGPPARADLDEEREVAGVAKQGGSRRRPERSGGGRS